MALPWTITGMSTNINLDYIRGILPASLENGQIPTAKAIELCRRRQNEDDPNRQVELLLAELRAQDFSAEPAIYLADSESASDEEANPPQVPATTKPKSSRGPLQLIKKSLFRSKNKS